MANSSFLIQVTTEGNKHLAKVLQQTGHDQREGPSYKTLAVALAANPTDAIRDAVDEAF